MQPEVRVDSCTSPAAAPERILAPCAGQGLTYNLHEASRCAQPWLQPMHQYAFNPSWGQQQAMDQSWQQQQHQHQHQHQHQQAQQHQAQMAQMAQLASQHDRALQQPQHQAWQRQQQPLQQQQQPYQPPCQAPWHQTTSYQHGPPGQYLPPAADEWGIKRPQDQRRGEGYMLPASSAVPIQVGSPAP